MNQKRIRELVNRRNLQESRDYIRANGVRRFVSMAVSKVFPAGKDYKEWFLEHRPSQEELERQKKESFDYQPLYSIVVPTYRTPIPFLREMIDSVVAQTYPHWELCIADGSKGDLEVEEELKRYARRDARIKVRILDNNHGIADNTNAAMELAVGDYIGLFDHDDVLTPDALYEITRALQDRTYDIVYTDEDKISEDSEDYKKPVFKTDFNMELFCSNNYITHFFVVKKTIADAAGWFDQDYDGSQDYDFMFRCIEQVKDPADIHHIPQILYHWRMHEKSVAANPASKMYAYDAGKRAIAMHYQRCGIPARVEKMERLGLYQTILPVDYSSRVTMIRWKPGDTGALLNRKARAASGAYLLFLGEDVVRPDGDTIREMASNFGRTGVSVVGGKILDRKDSVLSAGVILGTDGTLYQANTGLGDGEDGKMFRARVCGNYSAVSAACMMVKKEEFLQEDGFDPAMDLLHGAADYCMRVGKHGRRTMYDAYARVRILSGKIAVDETAYESGHRRFVQRWEQELRAGDPYYNPNYAAGEPLYQL